MKKLLLSVAAAVVVTGLTVGTAHADNFQPRGPFATLQDCNDVKAAAAKRGEKQGAGSCFVGTYRGPKAFYYMVKSG